MKPVALAASLAFTAFACGDNGEQHMPPDANRPDTSVDAPPVPTCEYTEAMDTNNDALFGTSNGEATGLMYAGTAKQTICGKLNSSHYDTNNQLIDVDTFVVHATSTTGTRLTISASGAESLGLVLVEIDDVTTGDYSVGTFVGTHAVASLDLAAGDYLVQVSAFDDAAITADIDYRLTLNPDNAATRCPKSTAAASHSESGDGATEDGNDVYEVRYGSANTPHRAFTALVTDQPENVTAPIAPSMSYHITGTLANPTVTPVSWMDSFKERDTYAITTGATTNELAARLNWAGTTADLDLLVFPMNDLVDFADAYANRSMEDEFVTFAVKPSTTYWFFVGADDSSTVPLNYDLTVCGAAFTAN
jgi:hypothetical protein